MDNETYLPYIKAFGKEVFRWRSVAIIGGQPHAPVQDDYYNGYFIPKNTWVQGNLWYNSFGSGLMTGLFIVIPGIFQIQIDSTLTDISPRTVFLIPTIRAITPL